jgi:signal transduction histidine kinase
MPSLNRSRFASPAVVVVLLSVLVALMYLQYQWTKQVSDVARAHVAADLRRSILAWHLDLFRSFAGPPVALQLNSEADSSQNEHAYAKRYLQWRATAVHTNIVANLYVWSFYDQRHPQVLCLDLETGVFKPVPWPEKFESLRKRLQQKSSSLSLAIAGASSPEEFFSDHPQENRPFQIGAENDDPLGGWVFDPDVPALFHPVAHEDSNPNDGIRESRLSADWVVIEYNTEALRRDLLPELAQRYFSGRGQLEYQIVVATGSDQSALIYSSDSPSEKILQPDVTMNLFGPKQMPVLNFSQSAQGGFDEFEYSDSQKSYDFRGAFWFPTIHAKPSYQDWHLVAKHRHGSLSEMFFRARRRDLAIGYGILLLLVVSMGLVLVAIRRAHELAKLQVDFVTAVSHDLRTPLSVISLAAENLADGVVEGREAVARYGATMQSQLRQLVDRVEQILSFAALDRSKSTYTVRAIEVKDIIDTALRNTSLLLDSAGAPAELKVEPNLPPVLTDPAALCLVLQNLITNAVKYGGEDHWLGIRARATKPWSDEAEIQIVVEDHGAGIERGEFDRIFEPFYRSPSVIAKKIRGTGLGLTLAKNTVEALGGSISVSSSPGQGSTFVVRLPAAKRKTSDAPTEAYASS